MVIGGVTMAIYLTNLKTKITMNNIKINIYNPYNEILHFTSPYILFGIYYLR
jgi:hypothetical protein